MPITKRALSLLLMLAAVAAFAAMPGAALGQSAGDDQYVDPFNDGQGDDNGQSEGDGQAQDTPPAASQDEPITQAPSETASAPATRSAESKLPRTGAPLGGLLIVGAALAGGGFALRRAWPLPD
jgi:hypothetical protein